MLRYLLLATAYIFPEDQIIEFIKKRSEMIIGKYLSAFKALMKRRANLLFTDKNSAAIPEMEKFTSFYNFSPIGYYILDRDGNICEANPRGEEILGNLRFTMANNNFGLFIAPKSKSVFNDFLLKIFESDTWHFCEVKLESKGPASIFADLKGILAENKQKCFISVVDNTELRKTEKAHQDCEAISKVISLNSPDLIFVQDKDLNYIYMLNYPLGLTPEDVIGKTDFDFLRKDDAEKFQVIKKQVLKTGEVRHSKTSLISKAGKEEFFEGTYVPRFDELGNVDGLVGYFKNVTELYQIYLNLQTSEKRLSLIYNNVSDALFLLSVEPDESCRFVSVNPAFFAISGLTEKQVIGRKVEEVFPSSVVEIALVNYRKAIRENNTAKWEEVFVFPAGEITGLIAITPSLSPDGVCNFLTGSMKDITGIKDANLLIQNHYSLLRMAGKTAKFGGWFVSIGEEKVFWSPEVAAIHEMPAGYSPSVKEEINFYAPKWRDTFRDLFNDCVENGHPFDVELQIITKKGNRIWVRVTGEAERDENGKIIKVLGSFQDISEHKENVEKLWKKMGQLERFQKMTIGRELKMIELKQEVNDLLQAQNKKAKYKIHN